MKNLLFILLASLLVVGCKTTEANYRGAYEKAIAARDSDDIDQTIYGGEQRKLNQTVVVSGNDTIPVSVKIVSVLTEDGSQPIEMKAYNVVVGQFKQRFNAQSLCKRWRENGYPDAFVVQTAEPFYYIVVMTTPTAVEAQKTLDLLVEKTPIPFREPSPFILHDPRKK